MIRQQKRGSRQGAGAAASRCQPQHVSACVGCQLECWSFLTHSGNTPQAPFAFSRQGQGRLLGFWIAHVLGGPPPCWGRPPARAAAATTPRQVPCKLCKRCKHGCRSHPTPEGGRARQARGRIQCLSLACMSTPAGMVRALTLGPPHAPGMGAGTSGVCKQHTAHWSLRPSGPLRCSKQPVSRPLPRLCGSSCHLPWPPAPPGAHP